MPPEDDTDLAGYPSAAELARAYRASGEEAKRQKARADQLEQRTAQLEQLVQSRQSVPQREDPVSRLSEYGVPVDALDQYVNERISRGVAAAFEPVIKGATARNVMLSSYPDYQKYEGDVAKFVNEDPSLSATYQRMFAAEPAAAMEWALLKYGETTRKTVTQGNGNGNPQAAARAEAQIPSNRAGDARTQPAAQDEMLTRTWDHYQKTGDPRAFVKARLRQVIPDEFLSR